MCMDERKYSKEQWDEKITDSINYFLILRAIVEEKLNEEDWGKTFKPGIHWPGREADGLCGKADTERTSDFLPGWFHGSVWKAILEIHRGKSCEAATSDNSEVWNYQCGCSRCIQKISGTDYPAPKWSEVYVSKLAIQRLFRRGGFCYSLWSEYRMKK